MTEYKNDIMTKVNVEIKRRLALAVCQGFRQESFVNEALPGRPVRINPHYVGHDIFYSVGDAGLSMESFRNLQKRLIRVGFVLKIDRQKNTVTMRFPEGEK